MTGGAFGIIMARGGSKGLPRKHQKILGGRPMLEWSFDAVKQSELLDRVIFTTDSEELAEMARKFDIDVPFLRPAELAGDTTSADAVLLHALKFVEERESRRFDIVVLLQGTSPFRTGRHIDEAIRKFREDTADCLISVRPSDYPAWWLFKLEENRLNPAFSFEGLDDVYKVGRQYFPQLYRPNGAIYIVRRDYLVEQGSTINPASASWYKMDLMDSANIDTDMDFLMAESVLRSREA